LSNLFAGVRWIWMNGRLIEFEKATVHVMSHGLHYGSGVFEGIRCYNTRRGPAVFRLPEHVRRLELSAKIYHMSLPVPAAEFSAAILETIRANGFEACYIRPLLFRGFGMMGLNPLRAPVDSVIAVWPWGKYLGDSEEGVDVCVSSWRRPATDALPSVAKATGNYLSSQLIKIEALTNGYAEGIALDSNGIVSEGPGENLFLVQGGVLVTPPVAAGLLPGITRDTVVALARDLGIAVREETITRGQLYTCDELFMTGTAAEITPVRSVDRYKVGAGGPGPVTGRLLAEFHRVITGEADDRHAWFTPVGPAANRPEREVVLSPAEASTSV
jgi:branched-chain amino acid aminotransferase